MIALEVRRLRFEYAVGHPVLDVGEFCVSGATSVAVFGASGSGKSTLLHCMAGLLPCDAATLLLAGEDLVSLAEEQRLRHRRQSVGFVFQDHLLLDDLPLDENVALPLMLAGVRRREAVASAAELLGQLGIGHLRDRRPGQVSGGERQRAAVARALVHSPDIIFADEPTGSLDTMNAKLVADALFAGVQWRGASLVLVTHDQILAERCDDLVSIVDGRLVA